LYQPGGSPSVLIGKVGPTFYTYKIRVRPFV
jgi:hypothetical protein